MKRILRTILLFAAASVFLFSSFMVFRYRLETRASEKYAQALIQAAVVPLAQQPGSRATEKPADAAQMQSVKEAAEEPMTEVPMQPVKEAAEEPVTETSEQPVKEAAEEPETEASVQPVEEIEEEPARFAPIQVDFDALWAQNQDVVAWLYCPETPINYPVVQALDNEYYLKRRLDGGKNSAGTLFMDYRNAKDLSDWNSLIYGHNMKNDSMFGTLTDYKKQAYFDAHPEMFLLTPQQDYAISIVAGFVTEADADVYSAFCPDDAEKSRLVENWLKDSDFVSGIVPAAEDRLVTLSTCSYEYSDARYVLIGILEELSDWPE